LRNEGIEAIRIKQVNDNPGVVSIAGLYDTGAGTGNRPIFVEPDGDLVAGDSGSKEPSNHEERISRIEQDNQLLKAKNAALEAEIKEVKELLLSLSRN
jgi:hypothetical protein